jgi:phage repressor protein C with HTH and peptisase S24 domain
MTSSCNSDKQATVAEWNSDAFSKRLQSVIKGESVTSFASRCGFGESLLRKYLNGTTPGADKLVMMAKAANVSIEWLTTGKEEKPSLDLFYEYTPTIDDQSEHNPSDNWSEFDQIPLYDIEVSAGHGAVIDQEQIKGVIAFRKDWLRTKGLQRNKVITLTAKGDSMEPTIDNGDLLLIDCNIRNVSSDSIYVIRRDGHLFVKRLQQMISGDLYIRSDNESYSQEVIPKDKVQDLEIIGRVVWIGHEI